MKEKKQKPLPGDLTGDGLGDAPGQETASENSPEVEVVAEDEAGTAAAELDPLRAQIQELNERLLRVSADFENYRRRVQREKEDLAAFANQRLILSLLPVLDNLDRALGTAPADGDEKLRQGVEMTARSFREILSKEGVTTIEAVGQPFDPNLHEAVMTVESTEHEDNVVVAEFQKGYKLGERVIRPSMVQVNKRD